MHTPVISPGVSRLVALVTLLQTVLILYVIAVAAGISQGPSSPAGI
jgi:hypothetical protein